MVSSSPFDLAKKTKNVRTHARNNNSSRTPRCLKKMERIRHSSDPDVESTTEELPAPSITKSRAPPPAASHSHGVVSVIGRKRTMADAVKLVPRLEIGGLESQFDFFAVYSGREAALCRSRMHLIVAMEAEKMNCSRAAGESCRGWDYWNRVMQSSFEGIEEETRDAAAEGGKSGRWTVVMVGKEELVVASNSTSAGDCRAVLYRGGIALPLSRDDDHDKVKSYDLSTLSKCKRTGKRQVGFGCPHPHIKFNPIMKRIRSLSIATTSRLRRHLHKPVQDTERMQGKGIGWNLNRSVVGVIGDCDHDRHHRVKPEVTVRERGESEEGEFVVIGSKGLWDVVSSELACDIVAKCFNGGMRMRFADDTTENCAPAAAAFLAELAMARGSRDNVSVIVVKL
ncbi:unnamed protein product [Linum trigynum]|uniref:PPM-type phosphatase domain-containing protein n=1 Tax=Linum trigynum TaxID=586398 RepID=A0AAV2DKI7_9ROSI